MNNYKLRDDRWLAYLLWQLTDQYRNQLLTFHPPPSVTQYHSHNCCCSQRKAYPTSHHPLREKTVQPPLLLTNCQLQPKGRIGVAREWREGIGVARKLAPPLPLSIHSQCSLLVSVPLLLWRFLLGCPQTPFQHILWWTHVLHWWPAWTVPYPNSWPLHSTQENTILSSAAGLPESIDVPLRISLAL